VSDPKLGYRDVSRRGALALVTSDPLLAGALGGRGFLVDAAVEDALDRFAIRADDR
jgi:hypothetical protein